jgi:hypothetical protein
MASLIENIPQEMRSFKQWIVWRYEDTDGEKPTKVPYSAITGKHASVVDPTTWASFDEAVLASISSNGVAGLGFVLSDYDPYVFVDLDDPFALKADGSLRFENPNDIMARQIEIARIFTSYSEKSPSGKGLHIICRGSVPSGRKRSSIEIYSSARYMTMTGDVYNNVPIADCNSEANALWAKLGEGRKADLFYAGLETAKLKDDEIIQIASSAANAEKFNDLYYLGNWQKYYPSQSEADFALFDIIAFYSENGAQSQRIFLASSLGQREKSRAQYRINYMLNRCFDRMLPPVDIDGLRNQLNEAIDAKAKAEQSRAMAQSDATAQALQPIVMPAPTANVYSVPPGLVGEIAQFIYTAAPRPVAEIALAGALGFFAGIVGRAYNVSGTGLNQYVLLLAPTGCHAKDSRILMHDGSVKLVQDVAIGDLLMGPDSRPRSVLNLARGNEQMARITPVKGESFIVNINHILPLIHTETKKKVNITVKNWLESKVSFKHCHKLQRTGVEFEEKFLRLDPWFLGALLGDGCFIGSPSLTGMDEEIHAEALKQASWFGVKAGSRSQPEGNKAWQIRFTSKRGLENKLAEELKRLEVWGCRSGDKFIPQEYKTACRKDRLALIAGLIDTDGSLTCNGYDYISKSEKLAKDVVFVCRSLGFSAYLKECEKQSQNGTGGTYYRVSINGDLTELPLKLERKKAKPRLQKKNVSVTGFKVELLENDDFYGFALNGDHLYLTDDFTIHHNTGKEAIASGVDKLMAQVIRTVPAAVDFIGPGEIASSQAVIKYMSKGPTSFVSMVGEFGIYLQQIAAHNAPSHLTGLRRFLLDAYNKSGEGKVLRPSIYSDREKNTSAVLAPAFTILGESTPEKFYEGLHEGLISEGLLPRFTTIEYRGDRPTLNSHHMQAQPSFELIDRLSTVCAHALMLNSQHKAVHVQMMPEAKGLFDEFDRHCDLNINSSSAEVQRHLWNRAHIKAMKLAALVAVGCNPYDPVITIDDATWARNLIVADVRNLLDRFNAGEIGGDNEETKQLAELIKIVKYYVLAPWSEILRYKAGTAQMHGEKVIPYSYLHKRATGLSTFKKDRIGETGALKRALKTLAERGDVQLLGPKSAHDQFGTSAQCYMISNTKAFGL